MMKRLLIFASLMLMVLVCSAVAMADATVTTFNLTGSVNMTLAQTFKDDATYNLNLVGNNVIAAVTTTQQNVEPYGLNVDSINAQTDVSGTNGLLATLHVARLASGAPYGAGGQIITAQVFSSDGTGSLKLQQAINYAAMTLAQYAFQNNDQLQVVATHDWALIYREDVGNGTEFALTQMAGSNGSAKLTQMNGGINGAGFGQEGWTGCFENSSAIMNGQATLTVQAFAEHWLSTKNTTTTGTNIAYQLIINQASGTTTATNPWVQGN